MQSSQQSLDARIAGVDPDALFQGFSYLPKPECSNSRDGQACCTCTGCDDFCPCTEGAYDNNGLLRRGLIDIQVGCSRRPLSCCSASCCPGPGPSCQPSLHLPALELRGTSKGWGVFSGPGGLQMGQPLCEYRGERLASLEEAKSRLAEYDKAQRKGECGTAEPDASRVLPLMKEASRPLCSSRKRI